jgi:hypothetical protein
MAFGILYSEYNEFCAKYLLKWGGGEVLNCCEEKGCMDGIGRGGGGGGREINFN